MRCLAPALAPISSPEIYTKIFPAYQLLIESYMKAQQVQKDQEQLDSQRG